MSADGDCVIGTPPTNLVRQAAGRLAANTLYGPPHNPWGGKFFDCFDWGLLGVFSPPRNSFKNLGAGDLGGPRSCPQQAGFPPQWPQTLDIFTFCKKRVCQAWIPSCHIHQKTKTAIRKRVFGIFKIKGHQNPQLLGGGSWAKISLKPPSLISWVKAGFGIFHICTESESPYPQESPRIPSELKKSRD